MTKQPEALRLADEMLYHKWRLALDVKKAVAELRRLHALNGELLEVLKQILGDGLHCDVVPHLHDKARAAIKKAEGA
jgi:hypothetical protein